jgi:hypothetical protein
LSAIHVFGIRHHGPGCARALVEALDAVAPDLVVIEAPADAQAAIAHAGEADLVPPVALLVYAPDDPGDASFYPFARFSPEWNALRWAHGRGVPARFMDLPRGWKVTAEPVEADELWVDPLGHLAEAAGYTDRELWWEHQVEQRRDAAALFEAIVEAMRAVREAFPADTPENAAREAHMRTVLRAAVAEGHATIAVVCGAWHAPALADLEAFTAKADTAILKGVTKRKTAATWVPWTHGRLAYPSGYGAGMRAPGWYAMLWDAPTQPALRFATEAARLLRTAGLEGSTASVIETVRLAEALAAMRGAPVVGLPELLDAIQAVLCGGDPTKLALVRRDLMIGEAMGAVPATVGAAPLQRDFEAQARRLRLAIAPAPKAVALDLRKDTDRERSELLHRLALLGLAWGQRQRQRRGAGTFHEDWQLAWTPELALGLIERSPWGRTIGDAAAAYTRAEAAKANLAGLTALLEALLPAGLPGAVQDVLERIRDAAALASDLGVMLDALPPLAQVTRYGDVRGTDGARVLPILAGLAERVMLALVGACSALDDDAARAMATRLAACDAALALIDRPELLAGWDATLERLVARDPIHGLVRGVALRLLALRRRLGEDELARQAGLALGHATAPAVAAAWIEGLVSGPASTLLHADPLWRALDAWLAALAPEAFEEQLPVLRRAFSAFDAGERRHMADKVKQLAGGPAPAAPPRADLDEARAAKVLPLLRQLLEDTP